MNTKYIIKENQTGKVLNTLYAFEESPALPKEFDSVTEAEAFLIKYFGYAPNRGACTVVEK